MAHTPDFDVAIVASDAGYAVHIQAGLVAADLPPQPFVPPIDLQALPRLRRGMEEWIKQARLTRLAGSEELRRARTLGGALFERLFRDEVLASFRASRAALPRGQRLRLRLRFPDKLAALPWELLYDKRDKQFLALAPDLALVRYPEVPAPFAPLHIDGALQVVAVLASPQSEDYPPIRLDRELRRIENALKGPLDQGRLALDVIRGPDTLGQLRTRLRRPVHVLHLLCHGDLDQEAGEGVLIFEDADGLAEPVNAELLRLQLQKQQGQTRLVLLNACLGALPAGDDPFSGVGTALLRGGVPAVIAMQFELAEDAAAELTRVFYAELAAGTPADLALTEARLHLYGRFPTRLDWAVPVLFLYADDGLLFEMPLHAFDLPRPVQPPVAPIAEPQTASPATPVITPVAGSDPPPSAAKQDRRWVLIALAVVLLAIGFWAVPRVMGLVGPTPASQADVNSPAPISSAPPSGLAATAVLPTQPPSTSTQSLAPAALPSAPPTPTALPSETPPVEPATPTQSLAPTQPLAPTAAPPLAPTAVPPAAVASGRLAFDAGPDDAHDIYVINADGSGLSSLTYDSGNDSNPAWSPDGRLIAFETNRDGNGEIYIMNPDGSGQTNISKQGETDERWPAWSPDGRQIAFGSRPHDGSNLWQICVMATDGTARRCIAETNPNGAKALRPAWSPDGERILFDAERGTTDEIFTIDADGRNLRKLTDGFWPIWSPDGQQIAFVSQREGDPDIFVMELANGQTRRLTDDPASDIDPAWSSDGSLISFASDRGGDLEIYVMNADGTGQRALTANDFTDDDPAWKP